VILGDVMGRYYKDIVLKCQYKNDVLGNDRKPNRRD
jgi:hypothetical protein